MWALILIILLATYVGFDASKRGVSAVAWFLGALVLSIVFVPLYFAKRPLLAGETREGGTAWNYLRYWAIFWTVFCGIGAIAGVVASAAVVGQTRNEYEAAGAAIGTGLGIGLIGMMWFFPVVGALLLGLMLRKGTEVERGPAVG